MTAVSVSYASGTGKGSASAAMLASVPLPNYASAGFPTMNNIGTAGILVMQVQTKNNDVHSCATAGWTKLDQVNSGATLTSSIFIAQTGAVSPTVTWASATACGAIIFAIGDPNNFMDVTIGAHISNTGSGTSHTTTGFNTTQAQSIAMYIDAGSITVSPSIPAGWTQITNRLFSGDGAYTAGGFKAMDAAGSATGAITITTTTTPWVQWQLELKVLAPGGMDSSKIELSQLLETIGTASSKIDLSSMFAPLPGVTSSKIDVYSWLGWDLTTMKVFYTGVSREVMWTGNGRAGLSQLSREVLRSVTLAPIVPFSRTIRLTYIRR